MNMVVFHYKYRVFHRVCQFFFIKVSKILSYCHVPDSTRCTTNVNYIVVKTVIRLDLFVKQKLLHSAHKNIEYE